MVLNDVGHFLMTVAQLNFTNSPYEGLAFELIEAFKDHDIKTDINILWVLHCPVKNQTQNMMLSA